MSTAEYMKDETGQCFIPASQRPDGTWRKARRVKDGYVPQEEMPLYESKGKQWAKSRSEYPVGLAPDDVAAAKAKQQANNAGIPGLVITPKPEKSKSQKKKSGGGKKKSAAPDASITKQLQETHISESTGDKDQQAAPTDPVKRLRNLRKKLRDIEKLEKQINSGELKKPEEDQLLKVKKKGEVLRLIKELEKEVGESN
ncbi:partner of Y14 and mago [Macrobrachium rosenbergii]|uniref:partner of Y14 and mago n=1 Tax=Macrobrachium rosenbergii TaxID=79674 RepID=UPI0034D5948C